MKKLSKHVRLMLFLCAISLLALLAYRVPHLMAWQAQARVPVTDTQLQILIPLYNYPNHYAPEEYIWDDVATAANSQVPITAIINPNSGPNGGPPNADYVVGLSDLRQKYVTIVGYVSTDYRNRSLDEIKADVDLYDQHFNIDGIFFDEVATDKLSDYQDLYEYVKTRPNLDKVIINPGVNVDEGYISDPDPASNTAIIFENYSTQWPDYRPLTYMANYSANRFAMLAHGVPDASTMKSHLDLAKQHRIGYVYLTDDTFENNPWDTLPSFWSEEVAYIQQLNSTPKPTATSIPVNTPTSVPSATHTPTSAPTSTPSATSTPTDTPTNTPSATSTPTNTPTTVPSATPIPTNTPTSVPSATTIPANTPISGPSATPIPTNTPISGPSASPIPTNTPLIPPTPPFSTPIPPLVQPEILIPLYSYPNWYAPNDYIWDDVAAANSQVPITAIINPNSGPGGGPPNADYVRGLSDLRNASVTIVGYVDTNRGDRPVDEVKADVDLYDQHFNIDGIFFDQAASSASKLDYYKELYDYVKLRVNLDKVIINPGNSTNEGYISDPASDVAVIFANDSSQWATYQPSSYVANYPANRFAMLAYGVPDVATMQSHIELAKERNIGYVYLTDDTLPNPWNSLPTFWQEEVAYMAVGPASTPTPIPTSTASPSATPAKNTPTPTNTASPSATPSVMPDNMLYLPLVIR